MGKRVAILIDGDNISPKYAECIKQEAISYGVIKIFRLYGSISSGTTRAWYNVMPEKGITPMLQLSYCAGKSIADQALTIDAMDLLHTNEIDTFCIVSSDSDYVKLIYRLKEAGKLVIGMGERKAKEALANACDEFKILDLIYKDLSGNGEEQQDAEEELPKVEDTAPTMGNDGDDAENENIEISIPKEDEIVNYIKEYITDSDEERINLATIGNLLKMKFPGFDARNYGYKNMTDMIGHHANIFAIDKESAPDGVHKIVYISKVKNE